MTALFASDGGAPLDQDALEAAVREMSGRGAELVDCVASLDASLASGQFQWERRETTRGPALLDDGVRIVVADASLYYRRTLEEKLRLAPGGGRLDVGADSACHLILAAYRVWGADCASYLEGDFCFAIWDRAERLFLCARDFIGSRPLFYGQAGDRLMVASTASAVARRSDHGGALDVGAIGESLASLFNVGESTSYLGVKSLPAGHTLTRAGHGAIRVAPHWTPPAIDDARASSFDEGAEELRALLTDAVVERMLPNGTSAVWLSGGWDSSSILASASLAGKATTKAMALVSMSYPAGDAGREDESILEIASGFDLPVSWCDSTKVRLLPDEPERHAAGRDLPFAHAFEMWSRAMVAKSREHGARAVLTGTGGDELFSNTNLYLADLFRGGQWGTLAREWRRQHGGTLRGFRSRVIEPALSTRAARGDVSRGGPFEQEPMSWLRPEFVREHQLVERERAAAPRGIYRSLSATELHWGMTAPMFPRIRSTLGTAQLEAGVIHRSPFFDGRIVSFAMGRPREERVSALETKRLLRHAMKGLLPDSFLAPRTRRTGITTHYLRNELRGAASAALTDVFRRLEIAEMGIVDGERISREWREYLETGASPLGLRFYEVYQTELWVRAHRGAGTPAAASRHHTPLAAIAS